MSSTVNVDIQPNFVDYFVVCGLDSQSGLEPDKLSGDNLHCAPLARPYKSKVLSHHPDNVPGNPFDEVAVGMLCLPRGLSFRTQRTQPPAASHSFIITKEDGSRLYGVCHTFYEVVTSRQICAAMQTLQSMHLAELSNDQSRTLYSHIPANNLQQRTLERKKQSRSLDVYAYDSAKDSLYVTKCICLLSQVNFVQCFKEYLEQMYRSVCSTEAPVLPLESYVYNILYEVPCPPPGRSMKYYGCTGRQIYTQRPGRDELPMCDYSLGELFMLLGIENVLLVFSCLLLENQILLYSRDYQNLMLVAESLCCLMYPFTWQHVYVPILPASLQHFLDAPVPFIMGLFHQGEDRSNLQLPSEANICFVDVDNKCVEMPEDLAQFPNLHEIREEITEAFVKYTLPSHRRDSSSKLDNAASQCGPGSRPSSRSASLGRRGSGSLTNKYQVLQHSDVLQRVAAIVRKTGVITSLSDVTGTEDNQETAQQQQHTNNNGVEQTILPEMVFNNALREIFLNHFVHLFSAYESFVICSTLDMDTWLSSRDSMQNFDKAPFLSDQPGAYLPFLSAFLETQMFTSFIDAKILSQWDRESDPALRLFDSRIKAMRDSFGESSRPRYKRFVSQGEAESLLERRVKVIDVYASEPHPLELLPSGPVMHNPGFIPRLNSQVLNIQPPSNRSNRGTSFNRRRRDHRSHQHVQHLQLGVDQQKYMQEARSKAKRQPKLSDMSPGAMSQTNWKFVETLLKECKAKTKRMVVEKMGQEAVELGHDEVSLTGVEENTRIAGLCDLLERIWSHGLQTRQGKSALWSHLLKYQSIQNVCLDHEKQMEQGRTLDPRLLSTGLSAMTLSRYDEADLPRRQKRAATMHRRSHSRSQDLPVLKPLPQSLLFDMRCVQKMKDIKTDIGYARAWIRLSLEKKTLCSHLKELLSSGELLKNLYKRYAFLRCEDEREQFMYHLLALNAVDYHSFTNAYISTMVPYRLVIFAGKKFSVSTTTANVWICLAGVLRDTGLIQVPRSALEFTFQHRNLGVLTTLRVGHDNAGMSPRWMIEHIIVRNEITGCTYRFPCGRWLGRGVDDGSTERLLVAEQVPATGYLHNDTEAEFTGSLPRQFIRTRSPSATRRNSEHQILTVPEVQALLGDSVNTIVKHFHKPEKERCSLTVLLCGESGLVSSMEKMFQFGFKSSRFLRNNFYIWDYLEKIQIYIETLLEDEESRLDKSKRSLYKTLSLVINKIDQASTNVGKDGKFQTFICIGARDHLLASWFSAMADTPVTQSMYEEVSFLRDPHLLMFVTHILGAIKGFDIQLEASITKGVNI